jgi:hypothetical protein
MELKVVHRPQELMVSFSMSSLTCADVFEHVKNIVVGKPNVLEVLRESQICLQYIWKVLMS